MPPTTSIIIPTFNRALFLKEAVNSVLAQTETDWELIIVDDGSTDETSKIISSFCDKRISYIHQRNKGVSAARNSGIKAARSEFIAFLDSDDLWLPKKLETQLEFFNAHPNISICQTEEVWVRRGKKVNPCVKHEKKSGWIFESCLPLCIVSPSAVMMRRSVFDAVGTFDETLPACEDYDLWLRASLEFEIHTIQKPLIVKRGGHPDQLSKGWGLDRWRIAALEKILTNKKLSPDLKELVLAEILRRSKIVADGAKKRGNKKLFLEFH